MKQITRREFVYGSAALSAVGGQGVARAEKSGGGRLLLVGTQTAETSKGIYAYSFSAGHRGAEGSWLAVEADNPTFLALAPNRRT